jgi:hypothetical protein
MIVHELRFLMSRLISLLSDKQKQAMAFKDAFDHEVLIRLEFTKEVSALHPTSSKFLV